MQDLFIVVAIASVLFCIVGLSKPQLFSDKKTGAVPDRKLIASSSIILFLISAGMYAYFSENKPSLTEIAVTSVEYGDQWPLIADEAILRCEIPDIAYIEVGGMAYALNGGGLRAGFPRGDVIRKDSDNVFMADFIERAMNICLNKRGEHK